MCFPRLFFANSIFTLSLRWPDTRVFVYMVFRLVVSCVYQQVWNASSHQTRPWEVGWLGEWAECTSMWGMLDGPQSPASLFRLSFYFCSACYCCRRTKCWISGLICIFLIDLCVVICDEQCVDNIISECVLCCGASLEAFCVNRVKLIPTVFFCFVWKQWTLGSWLHCIF